MTLVGIAAALTSASLNELHPLKSGTALSFQASAKNNGLINELIIETADPVFSAEGLHNEELLTNIFSGNFVDIPFDRDEQIFVILFNSYVTTYARNCAASLPLNKVELTRQECETERVTTNGYGMEVGRDCISWVTVGTGLYATPEMYNAKAVLEGLQAGDAFRNMFSMLKQKDPIGNAMSTVNNFQAAKADMNSLFKINGCKSPGIMRFQENLRLFALNKQPIRLGGNIARPSNTDLSVKNQNFKKLVEDLVYEHSKKWVMNRYQRGSGYDVTIVSRDDKDRPSEIRAKYLFQGFGGKRAGSVRLTFNAGLPECLYFYDFPRTCRTADRRIVAQYVDGSYHK